MEGNKCFAKNAEQKIQMGQNIAVNVEKYLEERHPNMENPLESNKKVDNEKNISEEKNEKELNIQMKPIPKKKRGEMSL